MNSLYQAITPKGRLDGISGAQLHQQIADFAKTDLKTILIDFSQIDFLDSTGLGVLITSLKLARSLGKRLCFCSLSEQVLMILQLTKMSTVFEIFNDRSTFEQSLEKLKS